MTASPNSRDLLRRMFDAAVASAQPALCIPPHLPTPEQLGGGRLIVIGAGKASAADLAAALATLSKYSSVYKFNGKVVISPFKAENKTAAGWK